MANWTREQIIEAAKKAVAAKSDGLLSKDEFCRLAETSDFHIYRLFANGWTEVRQLAGIPPHPHDAYSFSDDQVLQEFHRVASELGAIPGWHHFARLATISPDRLRNRFGLKQNRLRRYREWLEKNHPESPLLKLLPSRSKDQSEAPVSPPNVVSGKPQWTKKAGILFGAPIHFRGLRYAPINEQGVVYLFGMVSAQLGLIVEAIQSVYPDCEAKQCVDRKQDRWQRVRIEFEFLSSNFREHGHDPAGCDLVVCWEHDWRKCPVEVLELRSAIEQLEG